MPPIDLDAPYHEKDDAKRLGARWDAARKTWFLPDGANTDPLEKWLTSEQRRILRLGTPGIYSNRLLHCPHLFDRAHVHSRRAR
jgi:hypothetical protein